MVETINQVTKWVFLAPWAVWLLWEVALLILRSKVDTDVKTISMVAKDLGWGGLTSVIFAWTGLAAHYWLTWDRPVWSFPWLGVLFWVILAAFLCTDIFVTWNAALWPEWLRWVRYPPYVVFFGLFCGWFMFPQSNLPWKP